MINRKKMILIRALELIGEGGINELSLRRISKKEKISEPALYRHYANKKEILLCAIEMLKVYDEQIQKTVEECSLMGIDALLFYVDRYSELYESFYELSTILLSMDIYFYDDDSRSIMINIFSNRKAFLKKLITTKFTGRGINSMLSIDCIVDAIHGIMLEELFQWRLHKREYSLKSKVRTKIIELTNLYTLN